MRTSEAAELWTANQEFRNMLLAEAKARSEENAALRKKAEELQAEAAECHEQQSLLEARMTMMERELHRLKRLAGES